MALPTIDDLKGVVRVETTAEDTVLTSLLASATAVVRAALRRPIETESMTYTIEDPRASARALGRLSYDPRFGTKTIRLPDSPVDPSSVVLTDRDGNTVDSATYRVVAATGVITAAIGYAFAFFPYEATADVGLETRADYATDVEPVIRQGILDVAADFYFRRNSAATSERDAGGAMVNYGRQDEGLPIRVMQTLSLFIKPVL